MTAAAQQRNKPANPQTPPYPQTLQPCKSTPKAPTPIAGKTEFVTPYVRRCDRSHSNDSLQFSQHHDPTPHPRSLRAPLRRRTPSTTPTMHMSLLERGRKRMFSVTFGPGDLCKKRTCLPRTANAVCIGSLLDSLLNTCLGASRSMFPFLVERDVSRGTCMLRVCALDDIYLTLQDIYLTRQMNRKDRTPFCDTMLHAMYDASVQDQST